MRDWKTTNGRLCVWFPMMPVSLVKAPNQKRKITNATQKNTRAVMRDKEHLDNGLGEKTDVAHRTLIY